MGARVTMACEHMGELAGGVAVMKPIQALECPFCELAKERDHLAIAMDEVVKLRGDLARADEANRRIINRVGEIEVDLAAATAIGSPGVEQPPPIEQYSLEDVRSALEAMRPTNLTAILQKRIAEVGFEMAELEVKRAIDALERRRA